MRRVRTRCAAGARKQCGTDGASGRQHDRLRWRRVKGVEDFGANLEAFARTQVSPPLRSLQRSGSANANIAVQPSSSPLASPGSLHMLHTHSCISVIRSGLTSSHDVSSTSKVSTTSVLTVSIKLPRKLSKQLSVEGPTAGGGGVGRRSTNTAMRAPPSIKELMPCATDPLSSGGDEQPTAPDEWEPDWVRSLQTSAAGRAQSAAVTPAESPARSAQLVAPVAEVKPIIGTMPLFAAAAVLQASELRTYRQGVDIVNDPRMSRDMDATSLASDTSGCSRAQGVYERL